MLCHPGYYWETKILKIQAKWKEKKSKYRCGTDNEVPLKYTGLNIPVPAQKPNNPPCEERALWTETMDNVTAEKILYLCTGIQINYLFTQSGPWGALRLEHPFFNTLFITYKVNKHGRNFDSYKHVLGKKKKNHEKQSKIRLIRFSICQSKKT